jgi:site-specific recombinase XerD
MNRQAIVWEKGRRLVTVTFNRNTAIALNNYLQERNAINPDHNYVWLQTRSATFDPLSNSGIAAMLKATSIRAGCSKHVTAHSFRHAGAQFWSRNPDVSPVDTQNKLNHLHFKATQIYYAKNSFRVGTITDDHDILPTDISARLNGEESGIMPKNLIKFPRG